MSNITTVDPPAPTRVGRKPLFSDEQYKDLAEAVRAGKWASDQEPMPTRSGAYQRGNSAIVQIARRYKDIKPADLTTNTYPDEKHPGQYYWRIGPLPDGRKPRRGTKRPRRASTPASS